MPSKNALTRGAMTSRLYKEELYHYGVLGMRWGVRRFQPYPSNYRGDGKFIGKKKAEE